MAAHTMKHPNIHIVLNWMNLPSTCIPTAGKKYGDTSSLDSTLL